MSFPCRSYLKSFKVYWCKYPKIKVLAPAWVAQGQRPCACSPMTHFNIIRKMCVCPVTPSHGIQKPEVRLVHGALYSFSGSSEGGILTILYHVGDQLWPQHCQCHFPVLRNWNCSVLQRGTERSGRRNECDL